MPLQLFDWSDPEPVPDSVSLELGDYSTAFQSILFQRGILTAADAIRFLVPRKQDWYRGRQLRQVETACSLIAQAVAGGDPIGVYGDYDADGITSTALLVLALRKLRASVIPYLPNRFDSGYGLNTAAIDELHTLGVKLLITVDNGIRSIPEVEHARSLGMQVIVTDHHEPDQRTPDASALIDPKLPDDDYPNKHLAGVGVVYKLVCGLQAAFPQLDPEEYLDLVAIGTVADLVPLTGENRYYVRKGIALINRHQRQGIVSLLGAANLRGQKVVASDISYQIAPRLNATGRLEVDSADAPLRLLLSADPQECGSLAQELENHNTLRKDLSAELQDRVDQQLSEQPLSDPIILSFDENNHLGVAGIAAGYLSRKYYLPAVVGQIGPEYTTSSCRSIPEFDIIAALDSCQHLFLKYGGHRMAAGFTLPNHRLPELISCLGSLASNALAGFHLRPALQIDAEVKLSDLSLAFYKELEKLEPVGASNPPALLLTSNLTAVSKRRVGTSAEHLKLTVSDGRYSFDAIAFRRGESISALPDSFDLVYQLTTNTYLGRTSFQLLVRDLRPT